MTTSALSVSLFIVCSSWVSGGGVTVPPPLLHGALAVDKLPYESDGLTAYRQPPMVVVLPDTTEQVSRVLKYCFEQGIKVVPRGAGTSLSGGALPLADGVLLGLGKFKRIREIDFDNRVVVTEPGVTNLAISEAVAH